MAARIPSHIEDFSSKKARERASFVDQPGIEPRFSEPKSDVIAFIPLVNNFVVSKSGAKVQQKMHMTKYFGKKMHFFSKKVYFFGKNGGHGLHFATVASGELLN